MKYKITIDEIVDIADELGLKMPESQLLQMEKDFAIHLDYVAPLFGEESELDCDCECHCEDECCCDEEDCNDDHSNCECGCHCE